MLTKLIFPFSVIAATPPPVLLISGNVVNTSCSPPSVLVPVFLIFSVTVELTIILPVAVFLISPQFASVTSEA